MFFEPESWTGLRSPVAIEQNLSDEGDAPAAAAPRSSQLKVWASRIGAIVDWTGTTRERRAHRAGPAAGEFLHERRVFILDGGKR